MTPDEPREEAVAGRLEFEDALARLVFEAFAGGADVEGTWECRSSAPGVPGWTVTIRKERGTGGDDHEPPFLRDE